MAKAKKYPYHGRMATLKEICEETGMTYWQLTSRMYEHKIGPEEAVAYTRPKRLEAGASVNYYSEKARAVIKAYFAGARTVQEIEEITGAKETTIQNLVPVIDYVQKPDSEREDELNDADRLLLCKQISEEGRKIIEKAKGVHKAEGQGVPAAGSEV